MKDFRFEHELRGPIDFVRLIGSLDMYSMPRLDSQLNALLNEGRRAVLLDCRQLQYIASAGLGALIGFAKRYRDQGGDIKLVNVPAPVHNIMQILGFSKVLQVYKKEEEALASFATS